MNEREPPGRAAWPDAGQIATVVDGSDIPAADRKRIDPATTALYPCIHHFSSDIGLDPDKLIRAYRLEKVFHETIISEASYEKRRQLYEGIYKNVFDIYGSKFSIDFGASTTPKDHLVELLRPEIEGRSILDVGCGAGSFLLACRNKLRSPRLTGIDVFVEDVAFEEQNLSFLRRDVIKFELSETFDVAITDNVLEHIAPQDVQEHFVSVNKALNPGGLMIVLTPHRYFGPWDVTRIMDDNYAGWTEAEGTHLKEYTYEEVVEVLRKAGFADLSAIHPKSRVGLRALDKRVQLNLLLRGERRPRLVRRLQAMDKRFRYEAFEIAILARKANSQ